MIDRNEIARVRKVFWAYPAVLTLCDEIERLQARLAELESALDDIATYGGAQEVIAREALKETYDG